MTRALADLERDIRTLSRADKDRLLDFLMLDAQCPPEETHTLVRNLKETVERINESVNETIIEPARGRQLR